jgi:hypothetical protein
MNAPLPDAPEERVALKVEPGPEGTAVTDLRTGFGFVVPDAVTILPGRAAGGGVAAFDVAVRCFSRPIALRLRVDALPLPPTRELAVALCQAYATNRAGGPFQVMPAPPRQLAAWGVDAAASAIYPLRAPDEDLDHEECFYALKHGTGRVVVLAHGFSTQQIDPTAWSDFITRLNGSLGWGGPRAAPPRVASFFVNDRMQLTPGALAFAGELARKLAASRVPRAEVAATAEGVEHIAYGSDPPDDELDPQLLPLLPMTAFAMVRSRALRSALDALMAEKVTTYRDLRGLHVLLDHVARALPA